MKMDSDLKNIFRKYAELQQPLSNLNSFLDSARINAQRSLFPDLSKELTAVLNVHSASRAFFPSVDLQNSPFSKLIKDAARMAAMHSAMGPITEGIKHQLRMLDPGQYIDTHRQFIKSLQPHKTTMQTMIEAGQSAALSLSPKRIENELNAISKLYARTELTSLSKLIDSTLQNQRIWDSKLVSGFASRLLAQPELLHGILARFEQQKPIVTDIPVPTIVESAVIDAVEEGLSEAGLTEPVANSANVEASINRLFVWWQKLPQDIKTATLSLIIVILGLVIEYRFFASDPPPNQITINQKVKVVQKIANNVFVDLQVQPALTNKYRIVTTDDLPVFRKNRRDSEQIGLLCSGQLVVVQFKMRNWAYVEWKGPRDDSRQMGWVYTRYLKRVTK